MRPKSACVVCRRRRRKCIRSYQGTTCDFCTERNLQCIVSQEADFPEDGYEPIVPRRIHALTHKSKLLPPLDLCEELINLYFRYIHVSFHVLFHKPSFLAAFKNGSLSRILLFAVIGMSARFSQHESLIKASPRERGRPFTKEAERLLNLHDISLTTIQACLLLGASAVVEGEGATESVYFSIACRMGMLLDLPNAPVTTRIQQELNFRVWWALYETDTWSSTGVRLPKMMPLRNVPLPMAEKRFLELSSTAPPNRTYIANRGSPTAKSPIPQDSLIAHSVMVNQIFSQIDDVNSRAVSGELHGAELTQAVERVSVELDSWACSLPDRMVNTPGNLVYWTRQGFGNIFVVLHMDYCHLCQILFYQFLHGSANQAYHHEDQDQDQHRLRSQYAQKCRKYSTDVCNLIHLASETEGAELLNSIVGHVLTIASTVQLHILLFSDDAADVHSARRLLERNFELLTRLKTFWPCIDISFARFEAFHKACLRCQDDSHFQMDQWMLKFMLEFAAPLTERYEEEGGGEENFQRPWSLISTAI
ncbi:Fungal specific transcription factor domain-containing protein [Cladophialophora immunda]|nr:Fungal specific transcription factor domain-containing protein [Cladophialophora immunda]